MSNGSGVSAKGAESMTMAVVAAIIAHQLISRRDAMNEQAAVEIFRSTFKALSQKTGLGGFA